MIKKILLGILAVVFIAVVAFVIYVQSSWNKTYEVSYPDLQISTDSAVLARGEYLVNGPAHCASCHVGSFKDLVAVDKGTSVPLKGGIEFPLGPLGKVYPANLTPDSETGLGRYEQGQIFRMMRHAVKPNGQATLTPLMPFYNMADEDLEAIVSYLLSLDPVKNEVQQPKWTFLGKMIRSMEPPVFSPVTNGEAPEKAPPMEATLERGEYLANYVANCVGCHTPRDPQTFEAVGAEFSGGFEMEPFPALHKELGVDPDLWTRTPNITPHPESAFSRFKSLEEWKRRFRQGRIIPQSPMQWGSFSRLNDEDIEALWIYLNSLEPVEHDIGDIVFKRER